MSHSDRLIWVAAVAALLCSASWYLATLGMKGKRCRSVPCSYYDKSVQGRPGTCGEKEGDDTKCYCIVNDDKSLSQEQAICASR